MARPVFDPIRPGDPRGIDGFQTPFEALVTASGALETDSFAEQGLGRQQLASPPAELLWSIEQDVIENQGLPDSLGVWQPQALQWPTAAPVVFRSGAISLVAGDVLRIRFRVHLVTRVGISQAGIPPSGLFGARIGYRTAAGLETFIDGSQRYLRALSTNPAHGTVKTTDILVGPLELDWVQVSWQSQFAEFYFPKNGLFTGQLLRGAD